MDNNKLIKEIILSQKDFDKLPRNEDGVCIYDGDLDISCEGVSMLPDNLIIRGSLFCFANDLSKLPNNLYINGYLHCGNNRLVSFPDDMIITGNVNCTDNYIITEIKSDIRGKLFMDKPQEKRYLKSIKRQKILKEIK